MRWDSYQPCIHEMSIINGRALPQAGCRQGNLNQPNQNEWLMPTPKNWTEVAAGFLPKAAA